jgi:hypothetical protein
MPPGPYYSDGFETHHYNMGLKLGANLSSSIHLAIKNLCCVKKIPTFAVPQQQ